MLKAKKGFLLRSLGDEYIVVAVGEASRNFNGMIRLNKLGAAYWKELENGTSEDQLVAMTLEHFNGLNEDTIRGDIREFLDSVSVALDYDEQND